MARERSVLVRRCLVAIAVGALTAALAAAVGVGLERAWFGASDAATLGKIEDEVQRQFDLGAAALGELSSRVAASRELIRAAPRDASAAQSLFSELARALPAPMQSIAGVTVLDASLTPLAQNVIRSQGWAVFQTSFQPSK